MVDAVDVLQARPRGVCGAAVWGSAQIEPERKVERRVAWSLTGILATIVMGGLQAGLTWLVLELLR